MADPSQPERAPDDENPITSLHPATETVSGAYDNAAAHNVIYDEPRSHSLTTISTVPRRNSSVSHVSIDFFDPSGVDQLRRTMSHRSTAADAYDIPEVPLHKAKSRSTVDSTTTLKAIPQGDEPFDMEKILTTIMKRYIWLRGPT